MEKKYTSIQSFARIKPIEKVNDEFALCKVYVQSVGKNRNYSFMSKENIQKALPTLNYAPVVGHLIPKYDDAGNVVGHYMGSHDYEITPEMELKAITVPYGVVIEDSFEFEDVEEFGRTETYLTAKVYLWLERYPELADAIYDENTWFNQSMEISVDEFRPLESDSNYTELLSWNYSALCLLGLSDNPSENTTPAFISAQVHPVNYSLDKVEFAKTMNELKVSLNNALEKGGNEKLKLSEEFKQSIFDEFGITSEDISFEITEGMTEDEFRQKVKDQFSVGEDLGKSDKIDIDNSKDSAVDSDSWSNPGAAFLNKCLKASNHEALVKEGYAKVDGNTSGDLSTADVGYPHHKFVDGKMVVDIAGVTAAYQRASQQGETGDIMDHIQRHRKELGLDSKDKKIDKKENNALKYSATYQQKRDAIQNALDPVIVRDGNGEVVSSTHYYVCDFDDQYVYVDRYICTDSDSQDDNGRFTYSFDEISTTAMITGTFELMIVKWLTVAENQQIEDSRKEFEELKEFKRTRLEADHKIAVDEVLSDFEDIAETDEYKKLSESVYDIQDLDEIKIKCYAIRGKYAPVKNEKKEFSKKNIKVEFDHSQVSVNRYGDIFSKLHK